MPSGAGASRCLDVPRRVFEGVSPRHLALVAVLLVMAATFASFLGVGEGARRSGIPHVCVVRESATAWANSRRKIINVHLSAEWAEDQQRGKIQTRRKDPTHIDWVELRHCVSLLRLDCHVPQGTTIVTLAGHPKCTSIPTPTQRPRPCTARWAVMLYLRICWHLCTCWCDVPVTFGSRLVLHPVLVTPMDQGSEAAPKPDLHANLTI